jgi:hypothetical protein
MKYLSAILVAAGTLALGQPVFAQRTPENPEIGPDWKRVEGDKPSYFNAPTLMSCPAMLSDGYRIVSANTFQQSTDVSCGYRSGDDNVITFHLYPKVATPKDEINQSSRAIFARSEPGITPIEGQRDWVLGSGNVKAEALSLTDSEGYGQSFAIADVGSARLKARETWKGDGAVSHRVADSFFALQTAALTNARNCAALPAWPEGRRARLAAKPDEAAMGASVLLGVASAAAKTENPNPPPQCVLGSLGRSDRGSSLILRRTGAQGVSIALSDQPEGNIIAGLEDLSFGTGTNLGDGVRYALYRFESPKLEIYRTYRTLPNWEQIRADMISIATQALAPLIAVEPTPGAPPTINVFINSEAIAAEKAKRRPGSQ